MILGLLATGAQTNEEIPIMFTIKKTHSTDGDQTPSSPLRGDPLDLLTEEEVRRALRKSASTMRAWRRAGIGPPWKKIGGRGIRYRRGDLVAWLESQ